MIVDIYKAYDVVDDEGTCIPTNMHANSNTHASMKVSTYDVSPNPSGRGSIVDSRETGLNFCGIIKRLISRRAHLKSHSLCCILIKKIPIDLPKFFGKIG